jgi:branched-chain amino acid transport system substrate-binding protein
VTLIFCIKKGSYYVFSFITLLLILVSSGCVTQEQPLSPENVKVGILYPLTGDSSGFGKDCVNGTLLAIEEINDAGGIKSLNGAKIIPVYGDTAGVPSLGASETE